MPPLRSTRLQRPNAALAALAALLLAGCASAPGPAAEAPPPTAAPSTPRAPTLATERQWLQAWFADTPVRIAQLDPYTVAIDVPLRFSFDAGRTQVQPPLAAVLDKLAQSLHRLQAAQLASVAAPGDAASGAARDAALGRERAEQVRAHLRRRGVRAGRIGPAAPTTAPAVQLRVAVAPP